MLDLKQKTLLVIAPHPDDEVIGCAGLIQKVKKENGKVYILFLTVADTQDFSKRGQSTTDERLEEIRNVAGFLAFDGWRIALPGKEYHLKLDQVPQLDLISEIERGEKISIESTKPDIIVFPEFGDYNQDHRAAAAATFAACRPAPSAEKYIPATIVSSEAPMSAWSHASQASNVNMFLPLTEMETKNKMAAMDMYATQVRAPNHPRHSETLRALAQLRGSTSGHPYAEAFTVHKISL